MFLAETTAEIIGLTIMVVAFFAFVAFMGWLMVRANGKRGI